MSLRAEIHNAFDELEPSMFGLPERVIDAVVVDRRAPHGRREGMVSRLKTPLSLVAVMVLIALVVGALIGGRLVQDWNASHSTPAGGLTVAQQTAVLEARPWQQALLQPGATCSNGPLDSVGNHGSGPFHGQTYLAEGPDETAWGAYVHFVGATDAGTTGLLLIRARDLNTGTPLVFLGAYSSGPVVGTDTIGGVVSLQRPEVVLDMSHKPTGVGATGANGQTYWRYTAGAPHAILVSSTLWPACVGWQIDGMSFTETFSYG
ncbi:MAG TPA: hypothetical protein VGV88_12220 [Candidatus Dormibacteraeota bacterium]|nr:hypothetical protein [Candidatus Dormibacteraeota bacterium]